MKNKDTVKSAKEPEYANEFDSDMNLLDSGIYCQDIDEIEDYDNDIVPSAPVKKSNKKIFSYSEDRYRVVRRFFENRGDEFEVIQSGTTEKIRHEGKTYIPFSKKNVSGKGFHLSAVVKRDVDKWLSSNEVIKRQRDYKEQYFDIDNIEKNVGKVLISIDINDCYWQTIRNLGYITEKTYLNGLKKKEWKLGRNASIGSLCKSEMITTYKNGSIVLDENGRPKRRIVKKDINYQYVRHNVIGTVWDIFRELVDYLGSDFLMFLTDCVYTTVNRKADVECFLQSHGYTCKWKTFEITNLDKGSQTIEWIELHAPDTPKYYRYSINQLHHNKK